jgi:hypothetical protein
MSEQPAAPRRALLQLSLDGWAVLCALVIAGLVWADLLPPISW